MSEPYLMDLVYDWLAADEIEAAVKIENQGEHPPRLPATNYPLCDNIMLSLQDTRQTKRAVFKPFGTLTTLSFRLCQFPQGLTLRWARYRQSEAAKLFLAVYLPHHNESKPRELIGYICSTLSPSKSLTHESMSTHVPSSTSVCIHSACISPPHQRKGIGLGLLREYLSRLSESALYERVLLLAHAELRPFYEKAGFEWVGKSDVVHGSRPWFEMRMIIGPGLLPPAATTSTPAQVQQQQLPPGLLEQLQRPSHNMSIPRLLASFPDGLSDVLVQQDSTQQTNKFDLVCPRSECGSVILKQGVAQLVDRLSVQVGPLIYFVMAALKKSFLCSKKMEPPEYTPHPLLPTLPVPPATTSWWLVTPSPMAFENIGFTRQVQSQSQTRDSGSK
jgi:ribosomal protein S18 acetylase RimI-like enzyme